jgi:hypothetical protein
MNAYKAKPHIDTLTLGQLQQLAHATSRFKGKLWI